MRRVCLVMRTANGGERPFAFSDREQITIGRAPRCDLRVAVPTVASRHCEIVIDRDRLKLVDLGSTTGTFRNGTRIDRETELAEHDTLGIGPAVFTVRLDL